MKKILAIALALGLLCGMAYAEGLPASKAAAKVGNIAILNLDSKSQPWTTVLSQKIKTSSQKDLFVGVSLETGLYTQTLVKSKNMETDISSAKAGIKVRILVDNEVVPVIAKPGEVVFDERLQKLSATLQGAINNINCTTDPISGEVTCTIDTTTLTPEEIDLLLETMAAHSFNFILENVGVGQHTIKVQAKIDTAIGLAGSQLGSAEAKATIGNGSVTIEEVRLIKNAEIDL